MSERRVTCRRRTEEDRISLLPDHLLCEILSHVPTKTAVMTSVLSTRWKTIWLSVPLLDLHTDDFPNFTAFVIFISRFLYGSSCLHKLKLAFGSGRTIQDIINHEFLKVAFNNAVTRKVQHVDILYPRVVNMKLMMPLSIYTCETLVSLKLSNVSLEDSEYVSLPRLKIMHLVGNVYTNDAFLEKLISSCPVLEELTVVRNCDREYNLRVLQVRSKSLKSLVVDLVGIKCWNKDCRVVVIDAPGLNYLRLADNQFRSYVISNLSSSAKVDIAVSFDVERRVVRRGFFTMRSREREYMTISSSKRSVLRSFFTMLSSVRDMTISLTTSEGICLYLKHEPLPQFPYLIRLHAALYNSDLGSLPNILESCPNLRSLVLDSSFPVDKAAELKTSLIPRCLLSSLEHVEIKRFNGEPARMEVARYFVENSLVLKNLVLEKGFDITEEGFYMFRDLLALPKPSSSCQILLK